jgi:hypothetical protein
MSRIPHGHSAPLDEAIQGAVDARGATFDYLFPELQDIPDALLPESKETVANLKSLGRAMCAEGGAPPVNSIIPSLYTYFGQFLDHEITRESRSDEMAKLHDADLAPLPTKDIRAGLFNKRTPRLDLDCIYGQSNGENKLMRNGKRMRLGKVTRVGNRPPGKDGDHYDLPRRRPSQDSSEGGVAIIGDERNDENLIVAQLHVAFLRAHNALVDKRGFSYEMANLSLRQHFQWVAIHDFLMRIANREIVNQILAGGRKRYYQPAPDCLFMPLEFSVAAYRFGHSMVRDTYSLNSLFTQIPLVELFTQAAFRGVLGSGRPVFNTLPESWIIEWDGFIDGGRNQARRIGVQLTNHLAGLRDGNGNPLSDEKGRPLADEAMLPVRNLLRGYLLRLPTGQAVAARLGLPVMEPRQIEEVAGDTQAKILRETRLSTHTPLWYYILAEASTGLGHHLGPVGSAIVAEVLIELVRQSKDSILAESDWRPRLGKNPGIFTLPELLQLGGVLSSGPIPLPPLPGSPLPPPLFDWPGPSSH